MNAEHGDRGVTAPEASVGSLSGQVTRTILPRVPPGAKLSYAAGLADRDRVGRWHRPAAPTPLHEMKLPANEPSPRSCRARLNRCSTRRWSWSPFMYSRGLDRLTVQPRRRLLRCYEPHPKGRERRRTTTPEPRRSGSDGQRERDVPMLRASSACEPAPKPPKRSPRLRASLYACPRQICSIPSTSILI